ncbi:YjbH domain-containing protein [Paraglaciecola aquimarina]|uniref:YjbH domain-containing protein n=1 Tax=Paraglaciecola algarum TaxID=3050085 RepID=A0ABS9D6C9_9ALTE|nr:YjbH domain-containing protein [Paraglaciecola sp. G1-23]MCF2948426.1 YjbH domain-containing protein [Paraglaciecola sp. G1-23]
MRFKTFPLLTLLIISVSNVSQANTQWNETPIGSSLMVHGGTGLIQTPTSRMLNEGDLVVSYTDNDQYRFMSATMQLFPWMQTTVRYSDVRTKLYSPVASFSGDQTLKDKGIDVKFRLLKESSYLPEFTVGFRDFGGTGFFESEFLGLSKQVGNLNFHINMGWGYLGTDDNISNPFCELKDSFCQRPQGYTGRGGQIDYQRFFKGQASIFGGVEYQTPWQPLRLKLEYEGNNYINDRAGVLQQDSKWNLGAAYRWHGFDFSVNYQRGNTIGFGVNYNFNFHTINQVKYNRPPRDITNVKNDFTMEDVDRNRLTQGLLSQAGFAVSTSHITKNSLTLYGQQTSFRDKDEAVERIGRIIAYEVPDSINIYKIVNTSSSVPVLETVIDAEQFKKHAKYQIVEPDLNSSYVRQDISLESIENYNPTNNSGFFTGIETFWIQTFGNPEAFYLYQAGVLINGGYTVKGKTSISGTLKVNLLENFEKFNYTTDGGHSTLPRVRTNVREYVSNRDITMENLFVHWKDRIAPNLYAQAYGGYLESMYGGIGTELLYIPVESNLSFGFDINYVQQRSYENNFDFFDYKVLTGHANIYWQPEFLDDTLFTFNIGQYLAKDKGVTIDFAKRFDSGIIVGAYAAITNASAEDYGEGSFTKGFYLSIPFDLFSLTPARGQAKLPWVPISRDGGQALNRPIKLMGLTSERSSFY